LGRMLSCGGLLTRPSLRRLAIGAQVTNLPHNLFRERLGDLFFNLGLRRQADMMRGHPAFTVD
jgi:hypothetical protein